MHGTMLYGPRDVRFEERPEPGRVFDWVGRLEGVPDGYRAMNEREAIKAMIEF